MKPFRFPILLTLTLLGTLVPCQGVETSRPNLIVIYTDDHGWPDFGAQGIYSDLKTPNIDARAKSGARAVSGYLSGDAAPDARFNYRFTTFTRKKGATE